MGWRRTLVRLGIFVAVAFGVGLLLIWLADIPAQYPDHGLEAVSATEDAEVVAAVACLIDQVELDPGVFGVGEDFEIFRRDTESTVLIVHGWFKKTTVAWTGNGIRIRTNPLSSGDLLPTACEPWEPVTVEAS